MNVLIFSGNQTGALDLCFAIRDAGHEATFDPPVQPNDRDGLRVYAEREQAQIIVDLAEQIPAEEVSHLGRRGRIVVTECFDPAMLRSLARASRQRRPRGKRMRTNA